MKSNNPPEKVLDATCGGRSIWHEDNKDRDDTLYIDIREGKTGLEEHGYSDRYYQIEPDEVQDFRDLPYEDGSFKLIVWDPPHVKNNKGMKQLTGVITKKYGALRAETWQNDLKKGFEELWRVLEEDGVLVFKFANNGIDFRDVLDLFPVSPLFGTTSSKSSNAETRWYLFMKTRD